MIHWSGQVTAGCVMLRMDVCGRCICDALPMQSRLCLILIVVTLKLIRGMVSSSSDRIVVRHLCLLLILLDASGAIQSMTHH